MSCSIHWQANKSLNKTQASIFKNIDFLISSPFSNSLALFKVNLRKIILKWICKFTVYLTFETKIYLTHPHFPFISWFACLHDNTSWFTFFDDITVIYMSPWQPFVVNMSPWQYLHLPDLSLAPSLWTCPVTFDFSCGQGDSILTISYIYPN